MRTELHDCRLILDEKPGRYYHLRIVTAANELVTVQVTKTICETLKKKTAHSILTETTSTEIGETGQ